MKLEVFLCALQLKYTLPHAMLSQVTPPTVKDKYYPCVVTPSYPPLSCSDANWL